jgi:hypothetical protein
VAIVTSSHAAWWTGTLSDGAEHEGEGNERQPGQRAYAGSDAETTEQRPWY